MHDTFFLARSICQQISYTYMLPFENIPDDTVPVTAFLKELLKMANKERPLLIFLDSVDELTGSQDSNKMSWLPLKIPPHCKIVVSCTYEEGNPALMQDVNFLRQLFEDDNQFLEVTALGTELSWTVMKLWMASAGRSLNNFQWRVVANALDQCTLPIFCKLVFQEVRFHQHLCPSINTALGLPMEELLCTSEDRSDDERAGQCLPTLPEGGKQARLDVGTLQNKSFPLS